MRCKEIPGWAKWYDLPGSKTCDKLRSPGICSPTRGVGAYFCMVRLSERVEEPEAHI